MKQQIRIGTSGWSYKHWRNVFYPPYFKPVDWLSYYAQFFSTAEINNSFYRLPDPATVQYWMENVPDDFIFCPKASRFLSHMKKLKDPEEPLERMFNILAPLKKMMGPVLVQLPLNFGFKRFACGDVLCFIEAKIFIIFFLCWKCDETTG